MTNSTSLAAKALAPTTAKPSASNATDKAAAKDEGLGFGDLVDALNPLQHLPGVSSIYRHVTGDDISLPARLAGGLLFGGPAGLLGSAAMAAFESLTGDDPLGHVASLVGGTEKETIAAAGKPHALPSRDIVAAALARNAGTAAPAADATAATAKAATKELPAPQLLAKLYEMQATQPEGKRSIKL